MKQHPWSVVIVCGALSAVMACSTPSVQAPNTAPSGGQTGGVYDIQEGFVDAHGVLIYYKSIGHGTPLFILHGGPGASHDYFLPYLLPLARQNRLVFIDERGSGRSEKLEDVSAYTVENMVDDTEAVRQALQLGNIALLGHSCGGVLAAGLCVQVPSESDSSRPVQHVPQY